MNGGQEGAPAAARGAGPPEALLLACFAGAKRAGKVRRELDGRIAQGDDAILDQVVVRVNAKHKVQVHDPRRVLAGTLTPVLTWGLFGLLAGGLKSGGLGRRRRHLRRAVRLLLRAPADQGRAQTPRQPPPRGVIGHLRVAAYGRPAADPLVRRLLPARHRQRRGGNGGPVGAGLQRSLRGRGARRGAEHARGPVRR